MNTFRFRLLSSVVLLAGASFLSGCAMITEMANTPADPYDSSSGAYESDPYYRGHSSDASAGGIK